MQENKFKNKNKNSNKTRNQINKKNKEHNTQAGKYSKIYEYSKNHLLLLIF